MKNVLKLAALSIFIGSTSLAGPCIYKGKPWEVVHWCAGWDSGDGCVPKMCV